MIDPKTISQTLRRAAAVMHGAKYSPCENKAALEQAADDGVALTALADRLSLDGPPRVGDLVRVYSMKDAPENNAIVIHALADHGDIRIAPLGSKDTIWYHPEELRIVARAPYDAEALLEKRDA